MEEKSQYRKIIGLIVIVGGFLMIGALFRYPIPAQNENVLNIALGILLGWGGTVVSYEYTSSPTERRAATKGIKSDEPVAVTVENATNDPIPVEAR